MKPDRITRINERVREELSAALYRVGPGDGVEAGRNVWKTVNALLDMGKEWVV